VQGGARFAGTLARPPSTVGPFQNAPVDRSFGLLGGPPAEPVPDFYQDVAVVAYRISPNDVSLADLRPAVTTSAGDINAPLLWDGDYSKAVTLPVGEPGCPSWIRFDFEHAQRVQSLSLARQGTIGEFFNDPAHVVGELQSSDDGLAYRTIGTVGEAFDLQQTITFPATTARYFRLLLPPPQASPIMAAMGLPAPKEHRITELKLYATPRIDRFEQKAGFFSWVTHVDPATDRKPTLEVAPADAIQRDGGPRSRAVPANRRLT
jgi:alpha-L-rhamnosidase